MSRRVWLALFVLGGALFLIPGHATAHPADRLVQHLIVTIHGDRIEATFAVSGGLLATSELAAEIDLDGNQAFSPEEGQLWLQRFARHLSIVRGDEPVPLDRVPVRLEMPAFNHFALGLSPLLVTVTIPTGDTANPHLPIAIGNDYRPDVSDLRLDIAETTGGRLVGPVYAGRTTHLTIAVDPSIAAGSGDADEPATRWSAGGVVAEARDLFERPKTPWFIAAMLGIFAGMGALHAIQPGHGKTLVAAYLVATGGTPRDAMTLAGIVTATHTLSVYMLGIVTLLASEWFLPSHVIPVLSVISGLLVAGLGAVMLWKAIRRWMGSGHGGAGAEFAHAHAHQHAHDHHHHEHGLHHHGHDHAHLSEEEHARLHAAEIERVYIERDGRRRVSMRQLLVLGVSGGIAPCPDALAILLLSAGIGQAAFGMIAIVAFSIGLAAVLVAFGVGVALLRPAVGRLMASRDDGGGAFGRIAGRFATFSPVVSAVVVFALGVAMLVNVGR